MQISVLGPGGKPLLALMSLTRKKNGNLTGQFAQNGHSYRDRLAPHVDDRSDDARSR